jgi:hypothetical protein
MVQMEIGFIRLKRFVSPWGKLYFILDDPYLKGMDIIGFIRERIDADKGVSREHAC